MLRDTTQAETYAKASPTIQQQPERTVLRRTPTDTVPSSTGALLAMPESHLGAVSRARMSGAMQRSVGNARIGRMLGAPVQAKLTLGAPGAVNEQEADRVADQVMRMGGTQAGLAQAGTLTINSSIPSSRLNRQRAAYQWNEALYVEKLREAVKKLRSAGFGRAEVKVETEGIAREMYDTRDWEVKEWQIGPNKVDRKLVLKSSKSPYDAIMRMFNDLTSWNLDCAQFEQVAQLYAIAWVLDKTMFDARQRSLGGTSIELKPYESTGLITSIYYYRFTPSQSFKRSSDKQDDPRSVDQLLAVAPIGSRITWTNLQAMPGSYWQHENTLKIGGDLYAAHGFPKNEFSRNELERQLAMITNTAADDAYIKQYVFVSRIEHYRKPEWPPPTPAPMPGMRPQIPSPPTEAPPTHSH